MMEKIIEAFEGQLKGYLWYFIKNEAMFALIADIIFNSKHF